MVVGVGVKGRKEGNAPTDASHATGLDSSHPTSTHNGLTGWQGVYFHNCDCAAGASGGALLDPSFNVVGINTAHVMPANPSLLSSSNKDYNPSYPNIAVPAYQFMPTYAHILTQMS